MSLSTYTVSERSGWRARFISAPDALLADADRPHTKEFPAAPFLWGVNYTRQHLRRVFTLDALPVRAYLHVLCDNTTDVFLNGSLISEDKADTGCLDITAHLRTGENLLWIRAFQTAVPDSFTSAVTGGIRLFYADGKTEDIVTDSGFQDISLVTFWETEEPAGWESDASMGHPAHTLTSVLHPIASKRSCCFFRDFTLEKPVKKAVLYGTGLGCYEPHVNGVPADTALFMPSSSDKIKEYQTFDVTALLHAGENRLSAMTGNGWYNCASWGNIQAKRPAVFLELHVTLEDGTEKVIGTDETWRVMFSPLTDNDIQFGERWDARLELPGWDMPGILPARWEYAVTVPGFDTLTEQNYPPVRPTRELPVRYMGEVSPGVWMYDCGINVAGMVKLTLHSPAAGQKIFINCCERLKEDGITPELGAYGAVFYQQDSLADGRAPYNRRNLQVYTARGEETETYVPRFTYTGFRYIYVSGMAERPADSDIFAVEIHNDLEPAGTFESPDPSLMRIWNAVRQTWHNNCMNGPTDCPTREKNFWNGDTQIFMHTACFIDNVHDLMARWTDSGRKMHPGPYGWEDEEYTLPWALYRFYGDRRILEVKYPKILALIEKRTEFPGMVLPEKPISPYNDWLNPTGCNLSPVFFSGCWYLKMLDNVSEIADVLGDTAMRDELREKFTVGCAAFNRLHLNPETGAYDEGIQAAQVLPLAFGITPPELRARAAAELVRLIEADGWMLTTGFQGSRYLCEVLADNGYASVAARLLHRTEFPSWNFMFDCGATNITESWLSMRDPDKSLSMSHFSLGSVAAWFFEYLGGIRVERCAPGFSHVVLAPVFLPEIGGCRVTYKTPFGEIMSEWHYENGEPVWHYSVPEGVTVDIE